MAAKAKNSKKQQQAVATNMVTLNPFVVPNKIFVAKQPIILNDLKDWANQMEIESSTFLPVSGVVNNSAWINVNGRQKFSEWVASTLVPGATFKIKIALLSSLFQLLSGCIGLKSVLQDAVKLFCVEFASHESLTGATKVAIGVALCNVPLGTFSNDIKTALGIFGVVTSVKLKPAGLWQYAVVNFKNISSTAVALSNWSVLVRKDSVRILPIANQKEIISSRDAFKAKLVNILFGCTAFEISNLVSQLSSSTPKLSSNTSGGPKIFKPSFAESKSYAKAAAFVVLPGAAAADMNLDLSGPPKTTPPMVSAVSSVLNSAVESRLASLESHLNELSVLIKSLVEPVGALVVLITKLLSTPTAMDVSVKECVDGLANQNKGLAAVVFVMQRSITQLEKRCKQAGLKDRSDVDNMVDDDDDDDKDFSPSSIKSSPDQTAKWMSSMVKNSHELVSIMGKIYKLEMFDTLSSKDSTSV
ncbi:hypothetical protein G9A89_005575 [Geosiphon pyriformis]|nr:hypothetical protein G9A89_005575 [Geosiphon pyriformis]